jgi:hypothetical protein
MTLFHSEHFQIWQYALGFSVSMRALEHTFSGNNKAKAVPFNWLSPLRAHFKPASSHPAAQQQVIG